MILRAWRDADRAPFHAICSDPRVMVHLGPLLSRTESDAGIDRMRGHLAAHGYCFWAVEKRDDGALLGFCGLKPGAEGTPLEGEVEIGWRFGFGHWGYGYAREAAQASLDWGWANSDAQRIGAITVQANARSWGLMERLGMTRAQGGFEYPGMPDDSPLKSCIAYWIDQPAGS
nr:GNAT family N-acetyltransferase [Stakelama sediminis]